MIARSTSAGVTVSESVALLVPGLGSVGVLALLSTGRGALMVGVPVMVTFAPDEGGAIGQGGAAQPPPLTLVIVRLVGVSTTWMEVAVEGPALATKSV